jgi:hypothetical protein
MNGKKYILGIVILSITILLCGLTASTAWCADYFYYFSTSGSDSPADSDGQILSTECNNINTPCKTIEAANSLMDNLVDGVYGDNRYILFKEGDVWDTSGEFVNGNLTATDDHLEIDVAGREDGYDVVVGVYNVGGGYVSGESSNKPTVQRLDNAGDVVAIHNSYVTVENIKFQEGLDSIDIGDGNDAHYVTIQYCEVGWGINSAVGDGIVTLTNSDVAVIRNNTIKCDTANDACRYGIHIGNASAVYWQIYENTIQDWESSGLRLLSTSAHIRMNKITGSNLSGVYGSAFSIIGDGNRIYYNWIYDFNKKSEVKMGASDNDIAYNIFHTLRAGSGDGDIAFIEVSTGVGTPASVYRINIYNNVFYNAVKNVLRIIDDDGGSYNNSNNRVVNNIFLDWGNSSYYAIVIDPTVIYGSYYYHNMAYDSTVTYEVDDRGTDSSIDTWTCSNDYCVNNDDQDPQVVNPGTDFTLQPGSPCENAGYDVVTSGFFLGDDWDWYSGETGADKAIDPVHNTVSSWPGTIGFLDQDNYYTAWEIGAYIGGVYTVCAAGCDLTNIAGVNNTDFVDGDTIEFIRGESYTDATFNLSSLTNGSTKTLTFQSRGVSGEKAIIGPSAAAAISLRGDLDADLIGLNIIFRQLQFQGQPLDNGAFVVYLRQLGDITIDNIDADGSIGNPTINQSSFLRLDRYTGDVVLTNNTIGYYGDSALWGSPENAGGSGGACVESVGILATTVTDNNASLVMHDNTVKNCDADGIVLEAVVGTGGAYLYNNSLYNFGENAIDIRGSQHIYIGKRQNDSLDGNNIYEDSTFTNSGGSECTEASTYHPLINISHLDVTYKTVTDIEIVSNMLGPTNARLLGINTSEATATFDDFTFSWNKTKSAYRHIDVSTSCTISNLDIVNNVFTGLETSGSFIVWNDTGSNQHVYNNSFYSNDTDADYGVQHQSGTTSYINNIFQMNEVDNNILTRTGGTPIFQYNIWYDANSGDDDIISWSGKCTDGICDESEEAAWISGGATGAQFTDPEYENPEYGDLAIFAGRPGVDNGTSLGSSYADGLHPASSWTRPMPLIITRDQASYGDGWEIGAFVVDPTVYPLCYTGTGVGCEVAVTALNDEDVPIEPSRFGTYTDRYFHSTVRRVTDADADCTANGGTPPCGYRIEYENHTHTNSDNTIGIFQINGNWPDDGQYHRAIDLTDGSYIHLFPPADKAYPSYALEIRWHHSDPDIVYYAYYSQLRQCDFSTSPCTDSLVYDFQDYYTSDTVLSLTWKTVGTWDYADRYIAVGIQTDTITSWLGYTPTPSTKAAHYMALLDMDAGPPAVVASKNVADYNCDSYGYCDDEYPNYGFSLVQTSPLGDKTIVMTRPVQDRTVYDGCPMNKTDGLAATNMSSSSLLGCNRVDLADMTFTKTATIKNTVGGSDIGHNTLLIDADGNDGIVTRDGPPAYSDTFWYFRFSDQQWFHIWHSTEVSGPACTWTQQYAGYAGHYIGGIESLDSKNYGYVLFMEYAVEDEVEECVNHKEIVVAKVQPSTKSDPDVVNDKVWRVAKSMNFLLGYQSFGKAQFSQDGNYIYIESNWRDDTDNNRGEIYRVELPTYWRSDVFGVPAPQENNHHTASHWSFDHTKWSEMGSKHDMILFARPNGLTQDQLTAIDNIRTTYATTKIQFYLNALAGSGVSASCSADSDTDANCNALDTVTGSTVKHDDWDWTLKDLSDSDYRSALATYAADFLTDYTNFNGVMLDDVWYDLDPNDFYQVNDPPTNPTLSTQLTNSTNFKAHMVNLLNAIKGHEGFGDDHLLITNGGLFEAGYLAEVDGVSDEGYPYANWNTWGAVCDPDCDNDNYLTTNSWLSHQSSMATVLSANKYYAMMPGVKEGATDAQIDQLVKYSYATFLMGIPKNNVYSKHSFVPSLYYSNYFWYDIWDVDLGEPTDDKRVVPGETNIFIREFENGKVFVNPTDISSDVIQLDTVYRSYDKDGNSVNTSSITLAPRTGVILEILPIIGSGFGTPPLQ